MQKLAMYTHPLEKNKRFMISVNLDWPSLIILIQCGFPISYWRRY